MDNAGTQTVRFDLSNYQLLVIGQVKSAGCVANERWVKDTSSQWNSNCLSHSKPTKLNEKCKVLWAALLRLENNRLAVIYFQTFFSSKFVNLLETADLENFQTASKLQKC